MIAHVAGDDEEMDLVLELFERHHREVYAYLCHMVADRQWAEDLAQEAFLCVLRARRRLPSVANRRAWLYRIATNLALTALRRRNRFAWLPWRAAVPDPSPDANVADATVHRSQVRDALAALPPSQRAPLLLYAHHGLSVAEVAAALRLSEAAVKMRLHRARIAFQRAYRRGEGT